METVENVGGQTETESKVENKAVATPPAAKRKHFSNTELFEIFEKAESLEAIVEQTGYSLSTLKQKSSELRSLGIPMRSFARQGRPATAEKVLTEADLEMIAKVKGITVEEAKAISEATKKSVEERRVKILAGRAEAAQSAATKARQEANEAVENDKKEEAAA